MADQMEVRSMREVSIYLRQIASDIDEIRAEIEEERRLIRDTRAKRNFMIISAFVSPIIVTIFTNASGLGK